jgi:pre-rRNA-processing protein TSR1
MGLPSQHGQRNKQHNHGRHQSKHSSKLHKVNKTAQSLSSAHLQGNGQTKRFIAKANLGVGSKRERFIRAKQAKEATRMQVREIGMRSKETPKVVAVMTADSGDYDASDLRQFLTSFANECSYGGCNTDTNNDSSEYGHLVAEKLFNEPNVPQTVRVVKHYHRFQLLLVDHGHKLQALEAIKCADVLVVVASAHSKREDKYEQLNEQLIQSTMPTLRAQGLPPTIVALRNSNKVSASERNAARKLGMKICCEQVLCVPKDKVKSCAADTEQEMKMLIRQICEQRAQPPAWRTHRPYVISEFSSIELLDSNLSNLIVEGYVRGCGLSVNHLFHVPGVGDFPLEKVEVIEERVTKSNRQQQQQRQESKNNSKKTSSALDFEMGALKQATLETLTPDPEKMEPVVRENKPQDESDDDEDAYDERLDHLKWEDAEKAKMKKRLKPKGWSDYQASWIPRDASDDEGSILEEEDMLNNGDDEHYGANGDFLREEKDSSGIRKMLNEEDVEMDAGWNPYRKTKTGTTTTSTTYTKTTKNVAVAEEEENNNNNIDDNNIYRDEEMIGDDDGDKSELEFADDDSEEEQENWDGDLQGDISSDDDEETLKNLLQASKDSAKRARLRAMEDENFEYPDEVEFPEDIEARRRFAKYKGLKSFRTSPWDPKENLPRDYARSFALQSYKRLGKRSMDYLESTYDLEAGTYVRLTIKGVPTLCLENLLNPESSAFYSSKILSSDELQLGEGGKIGLGVGQPWRGWTGGAGALVISGLLRHETRMTVMHFGIQKRKEYTDPVPSKHPMWWHVGFRREKARAIFSHDGLNADKFKFERFLPPRVPSMASLFMPITFAPAPVLGFSEKIGAGGSIQTALVCSGNVRTANPDRIALKRVVITGYPFRTHKHKGVIRYMFFNAEDVKFFSPLELWTKYGRRGKITDALGTHGHMKCLFNGVILQHDTVCVTMYKRVFPKLERHAHQIMVNGEVDWENELYDNRISQAGDKMQMY